MANKIIILSTFWYANKMIENQSFLMPKDDGLCQIDLSDNKYCVYSIALTHPSVEKQIAFIGSNIREANCLKPTYKLLMDYKKDKDWEKYKIDYVKLMKERKQSIYDFISSMEDDMVYFLCCWENTIRGANCHRKIIYDICTSSTKMKEMAIWRYVDE